MIFIQPAASISNIFSHGFSRYHLCTAPFSAFVGFPFYFLFMCVMWKNSKAVIYLFFINSMVSIFFMLIKALDCLKFVSFKLITIKIKFLKNILLEIVTFYRAYFNSYLNCLFDVLFSIKYITDCLFVLRMINLVIVTACFVFGWRLSLYCFI